MATSGTKFYVNNVTGIDNDKCFREAIKAFPEGIGDCVKLLVLDTEEAAPELEEIVAYIGGQSIAGIKISLLKTGETTVFIGWNANGIDILLGFEYLKAAKKLYPGAIVTYSDGEGGNTDFEADLSEDAMNSEWGRRFDLLGGMMGTDEEVINIPAIRHCYHLMPSKFAKETEGMDYEDKVKKLYHDILDLQWYHEPEPKSYMLRWNTAVSNFKVKDFEKCMDLFRNEDFCMSWSIWDWQDVRVGDKVYLLRVGEGKTGIVMRGEIISDSYVDQDWSGKGRIVHYVYFKVTEMMHPEKAVIPTTDALAENWRDIEWNGGHSGTLLSNRDAYSLDKYFDRFLVDNREQFSASENNGIALSAEKIPSEYKDYFDPNQGHGGHWATIVDTEEKDHGEFLKEQSVNTKPVHKACGAFHKEGEEQECDIIGLSTNSPEIGMHMLVSKKGDLIEYVSAYPEVGESGAYVTLKLIKINKYSNGLEAVLTGETEDGNQLCFFDSEFYANKDSYEIGHTYTFRLAALACKAEEMPEEERAFTMSVEETLRMAEVSGCEVRRDEKGNVIPNVFVMDELVACINTVEEVPDEYEFQSPVRNVKSVKVFGTPMYRMDVTVIRTDDEPDVVVIPLYAKKEFFDKKPKKNAPVRGWLWMLGKRVDD